MIDVVCGIIFNKDGKVFIARRKPEKSLGGLWEFPGGRVEDGENEEHALRRELEEEIGMHIDVQSRIGQNEHDYGSFEIRLTGYRCLFLSAEFRMNDHDKFEWVEIRNLVDYEMASADKPLIKLIK